MAVLIWHTHTGVFAAMLCLLDRCNSTMRTHLFSSFVVEWLKPSAGVRLLFLVRQVLTAVRT